ncbi:nuclease-related domain-containing protein [Bacillus methanolicus]|uniref:nuclease-related domain-containing protein n=1 Tax=Bacillus methanolicus TaxID=1471 RepID=UPI003D80A615
MVILILKELQEPIRIKQTKALLRRIPKDHHKRTKIEDDQNKRTAGFRGEEELAYYLKYLNENKYYIFFDLRLLHDQPFQIDALILSPSFALIIEVKNYSGTLFLDKYSKQLIRIIENNEEGFPNPLSQVKRQKQQLKVWLGKRKINILPIEYLVVISQTKTILKTTEGNQQIFQRIIPVDQLLERIAEFELKYDKKIISNKEIQKINQLLLREHTPHFPEILQTFGINSSEIIKGVQCPKCHSLPMIRIFGTWKCPVCKTHSKSAHQQAIYDYFLLINSTITNKECREFLQISSQRTVRNLLISMNLPFSGTNKGRIYHRPEM